MLVVPASHFTPARHDDSYFTPLDWPRRPRRGQEPPVNSIRRWAPYAGSAIVLLVVLGWLVNRSRGIARDA